MNQDDQASQSFELFLDTICNTFGGIVFLAILLAIMIQTRSVIRMPEDSQERASPQEIREAIDRLDSLTLQREQLLAASASLPELVYPEKQTEYLKLEQERQTIESQLAVQIEKQEKESRKLATILTENSELAAQNETIPKQVESAEEDLRKTQTRLNRLVEAAEKPLRIGIARTSSSGSYLLLISNDKIYFARKPTLFGSGFNNQHVVTQSFGDGSIGVFPKDNAGWEIGTPVANRELVSLVDEAKASGMTLTFAVWPESYEEYSELREEMIQRGILIQLWPQAAGEDLLLTIGEGVRSIVQ